MEGGAMGPPVTSFATWSSQNKGLPFSTDEQVVHTYPCSTGNSPPSTYCPPPIRPSISVTPMPLMPPLPSLAVLRSARVGCPPLPRGRRHRRLPDHAPPPGLPGVPSRPAPDRPGETSWVRRHHCRREGRRCLRRP